MHRKRGFFPQFQMQARFNAFLREFYTLPHATWHSADALQNPIRRLHLQKQDMRFFARAPSSWCHRGATRRNYGTRCSFAWMPVASHCTSPRSNIPCRTYSISYGFSQPFRASHGLCLNQPERFMFQQELRGIDVRRPSYSRSALPVQGRTKRRTKRIIACCAPVFENGSLMDDTIFALSSGSNSAAGIAVIRISGRYAVDTACQFLTKPMQFPKPRVATLRRLHHPVTRELLDCALLIYFPRPNSFTGEDVVEFHVHGSRAVIAGVIDALAQTRARPAERGEFTRRAFENGRMDLTEVEGLADLIAADTAEQRRQALRQMGGDLRKVYEAWREEVKGCLAHAEAVIDFGDDVDDGAFEAVLPRVTALSDEIKMRLNDDRRGEIVRDGVRLAIVGPPNAGKSTLLNILAKRPAAIVSPFAGTTRDVVEVSLDISGVPVLVSDTAGLRSHCDDPIELEGIRRARAVAAKSDIVLFMQDASAEPLLTSKSLLSSKTPIFDRPQHGDSINDNSLSRIPCNNNLSGHHGENLIEQSTIPDTDNSSVIYVVNKADLVEQSGLQAKFTASNDRIYVTSLRTGKGINALLEGLERIVLERTGSTVCNSQHGVGVNADAPIVTRARHRHHLSAAVRALDAFIAGRTYNNSVCLLPMDLATEELRIASRELGAITGVIHVEEILDVIFNDFCIGK